MSRARHSIHRRLTGWLLGGVGLLLLITGVTLDVLIGERLKERFDLALLAKARTLIALTDQDREGVDFDLSEDLMPEFEVQKEPEGTESELDEETEYFQLWWVDGRVLARSSTLADQDLSKSAEWDETPRFSDLGLPDGRLGRQVQIGFLPHIDTEEDDKGGADNADRSTGPANSVSGETVVPSDTPLKPEPLILILARGRAPLDELLAALRLMLLIAGASVIGLTVLLVRFAVGISLRPLAEIHRQVERLNADSLDARVKPSVRTEELDGVVNQFNALLERLETAFERERRFSSDVAHELRTPLAELHNLAEVGSRWSDDPTLARDFFDEMLGATRQIERIVENLLALARFEKGQAIGEPTDLDLVALIEAAWRRMLPETQAKALILQRQGPAHLMVRTGRDQNELIFNNLFSNAVAYSPAKSRVIYRVTENDSHGRASVSIVNHAEYLDSKDLPHLFERLWRKDPARTGGNHAGLGLNLVKAYAEQLNLTTTVALEPDRTFRITLSGFIPVPHPTERDRRTVTEAHST
ncbi:MAG: hypothetical protein H6970_07645 [Gammaproteobacteria bacterium]|nr:hypothetical protein [Gammaproteobacteria bacterium]MCP5458097.1 hypothetical protein [Gammaproteobacteria bacterium]